MKATLPWCLLLLLGLALPAAGQAQAAGADRRDSAHGIPPPPHRSPPGVLRVLGHPQAAAWVSRQAEEFRERHPGIRVDARLTGSDVGMAALYTGQADIVLMGREATESEIKAFEWVFRYRPTAVPILAGSLDRVGQAPALVVFVHRDNPVPALSLAQLDGIFGTERENGWHDGQPVSAAARGSDRDIRAWRQLGLDGDWAQRPIRIYAPMAESGTGKFFRVKVLADSNRMHWDAIEEFADSVRGPEDSGARILAALARDPAGLALSNLQFARPEVRAVPLADGDGAPVEATRDSLAAGTYPLARTVYAYINRPPEDAIDPQVLAWLQDVLGADGQRIAEPTGYLPLPPGQASHQLRLLSRMDAAPRASAIPR